MLSIVIGGLILSTHDNRISYLCKGLEVGSCSCIADK